MIIDVFFLLLNISISYILGVLFGFLLFQFLLRKKCTGTNLTDGCGKIIYPFYFKDFFINNIFRFPYLMFLTLIRKKRFNEILSVKNKLRYKYDVYTFCDIQPNGNTIIDTVSKSCCEKCWEKHQSVEVIRELTKYN